MYHFSSGTELEVWNPKYLHVSESGGHRLFTEDGKSYYIRACEGWYIEWKAKPGFPHFVK